MSGQRVNRISVDIDKDDFVTISLYKTNTLLGVIEGENLDILPLPSESGVSKSAYQLYVRDVIINLLDNGGIEGFYYEEKQKSESVKYDNNAFLVKAKEYVKKIIDDEYEFTLISEGTLLKAERYNSGFIKNATAEFRLTIKNDNGIKRCILICEIKSGQMCRPKTMIYNDEPMPFNITSIRKIMKR